MATKNRQLAYLFDEVGALLATEKQLGGKGLGLVQMAQAGRPVPSGFTLLTGLSRAHRQEGSFPKRLAWWVHHSIAQLEKRTNRNFGGSERPLLVSVRSGAPVSMPGMMDTVLNLGLNETTLQGLIDETGDELFAWKTYALFLAQFGETVQGVSKDEFAAARELVLEERGELNVPALQELCGWYRQIIEDAGSPMLDDPWEQLQAAIEAVCLSWDSERARAYRQTHGIPESLGTAVNVQAMVFGNAGDDSGTGVVFSRNVATGEPELYGEFLQNAQGEDLVAGVRTPEPIATLASNNPRLYGELAMHISELEKNRGDVVDVEFTVERGQLYLLQSRVAKRTPSAAVQIAVDMVSEGRWTKEQAVRKVPESAIEVLTKPQFDPEAFTAAASNGRFLTQGLPASGGAAIGKAVFSSARAKQLADAGEKVILVRSDTSPDDFPGMLAAQAIVTETGGATCHAAVVARGLGKPAVVGARDLEVGGSYARAAGHKIEEGQLISVDGSTGVVVLDAVPLKHGVVVNEKAQTFLAWVEELRPTPKVRLELRDREWNANTLLNDFYLADALRQASVGNEFEQEASALYRKIERQVADVFATYLLIAVAGELRHSWKHVATRDLKQELDLLKERGVVKTDTRRDVQHQVLESLSKLSPNETLLFLEAGAKVFHDSGWDSSFGGKKWAVITETLLSYLSGKLQTALFVDRVFDLRHNGNRLFDKHPMVRETDDHCIRGQLDAKKTCTGGVKELVKQLTGWHTAISPAVVAVIDKVNGP